MAQDNQGLMISSIVAIVAVVGLVIVLTGGPSAAQTVEVYNPQAGGGNQFGQILTPQGYCYAFGDQLVCPTAEGFAPGQHITDQGRDDLIQGYFDVEKGLVTFGQADTQRTFGVPREFREGALEGVNCWQEVGGWVCTGFD